MEGLWLPVLLRHVQRQNTLYIHDIVHWCFILPPKEITFIRSTTQLNFHSGYYDDTCTE
jgi:hypothetical protein